MLNFCQKIGMAGLIKIQIERNAFGYIAHSAFWIYRLLRNGTMKMYKCWYTLWAYSKSKILLNLNRVHTLLARWSLWSTCGLVLELYFAIYTREMAIPVYMIQLEYYFKSQYDHIAWDCTSWIYLLKIQYKSRTNGIAFSGENSCFFKRLGRNVKPKQAWIKIREGKRHYFFCLYNQFRNKVNLG